MRKLFLPLIILLLSPLMMSAEWAVETLENKHPSIGEPHVWQHRLSATAVPTFNGNFLLICLPPDELTPHRHYMLSLWLKRVSSDTGLIGEATLRFDKGTPRQVPLGKIPESEHGWIVDRLARSNRLIFKTSLNSHTGKFMLKDSQKYVEDYRRRCSTLPETWTSPWADNETLWD